MVTHPQREELERQAPDIANLVLNPFHSTENINVIIATSNSSIILTLYQFIQRQISHTSSITFFLPVSLFLVRGCLSKDLGHRQQSSSNLNAAVFSQPPPEQSWSHLPQNSFCYLNTWLVLSWKITKLRCFQHSLSWKFWWKWTIYMFQSLQN